MAEAFGIEGRGRLYDEVGAVRDVVQNHLLEVVAFLAMEPPITIYPESLRDEQVKVFCAMPPIRPDAIVRGQFAGYRNEPGVHPGSHMETYAATRIVLDSWRWSGVPFLIRAGKRLPVTATEVIVKLKEPPLRQMPHDNNYFRFRLGPDLSLSICARVKRPGVEMVSMPVELSAVKLNQTGELQAYERLLTDAMHGDALLFVRQDAVEAAWGVVEPILHDPPEVHEYAPGTWGRPRPTNWPPT